MWLRIPKICREILRTNRHLKANDPAQTTIAVVLLTILDMLSHMTAEAIHRYRDVLSQFQALEYGDAKLGVAERLVEISRDTGLLSLEYHARLLLVSCLTFIGQKDRCLVEFAWLLGKYDSDPDYYNEFLRSLLWRYKWMVSTLQDYPQFSLQDIEGRFDDIERRFVAAGYDLGAVWKQRCYVAMGVFNDDDVRSTFAKWQMGGNDEQSDCYACEVHFQTKYHLYFGELDEALKSARPLIDGEASCESIPHGTFNELAVALDSHSPDLARELHRRGWTLISERIEGFAEDWAMHVEYAARHLPDEVAGMVSPHYAHVQGDTPWTRCFVESAAIRAFETVGEVQVVGGETLDQASVATIRADLTQTLSAFDARNGNTGMSEKLNGIFGCELPGME